MSKNTIILTGVLLLYIIENQLGLNCFQDNNHFSWINLYINITTVFFWNKLINFVFRISRLAAEIKRERDERDE